MEILINSIIIVVCVIVLAKGSTWLVDSAVIIAHWLGIPTLIIGLTVVAFGTSAPEFGVTLLSGFQGKGDISVGNIVGSNIFNLGFILGGTAMVRSLNADKASVYRDGAFLLLGTVLLTIFIWDLSITRTAGFVLFSLLIIYLAYLFLKKQPVEEVSVDRREVRWYDFVFFFLGLGMIVGGAHFLVESSVIIAKMIGISEWVIGVTVVAFGTSAPELAISLTAALKGHHGISVGNLLGSDIFNMFGVLGLTAILKDLSVEPGVHSNMLVLVGMVLLVCIFMWTRWRISRLEGLILIIIGLARWFYSFYFGT
ncbi:MAG: calcium/sodium antiporter [Bacteroidales bacterium]|nr:calcium/sodium antiporter [Bacteroidales bacterium]